MPTVTQKSPALAAFNPRLTIGLGASVHRASIEPEEEFGCGLVRVNIDAETSFTLEPNEALALAAALQAVAVHQMEEAAVANLGMKAPRPAGGAW